MKKTGMVLAAYFCVVCTGVFAIHTWESRQSEFPTGNLRPEGYQTPTAQDRAASRPGKMLRREGRVTKLEIAPNVPKYFDEKLELVALAPGSGWLRFKTGDGITPTLDFKKVSRGDVRRFNAFAQSTQSPIRVNMAGNVLHISAEETAEDLALFEGKEGPAKPRAFYYGFNKTDTAPRVVMRKNEDGKVFLVRAPETEEAVETVAAK